MASRGGIRLIQDQNLNIGSNGSGSVINGSKGLKKGPVGGRKPLGDLSNAGKQPFLNQTSKKQSLNGLTVIKDDEIVADPSKFKINATRKRSTSKTADKAPATGRKALTDISNSRNVSDSEKPLAPETLKKKTSINLGPLAEDMISADAIVEEQFLHNHEQCIKMQASAMDSDYFLKILGLNEGPAKQFEFFWPSPVSSKPVYKEMVEVPMADQSPSRSEASSGLGSPNPCQTPSPEKYAHWKDDDSVDFMLMDSPILNKH